jgi:hypothetical protein
MCLVIKQGEIFKRTTKNILCYKMGSEIQFTTKFNGNLSFILFFNFLNAFIVDACIATITSFGSYAIDALMLCF